MASAVFFAADSVIPVSVTARYASRLASVARRLTDTAKADVTVAAVEAMKKSGAEIIRQLICCHVEHIA